MSPWLRVIPLTLLPVAAVAAGQYDGAYRGASSVVRGGPPTCTAAHTVTWTVADNHLRVNYGVVTLEADVAGDGTFRSTTNFNVGRAPIMTTLSGQIVGKALTADIDSHSCAYHYALNKQ